MALLADRGELGPRPDVAVFADTGWEPQAVYEHLRWLKPRLSYPTLTVSRDSRSLRDDTLAGVNARGRPWTTIPVWLAKPDGTPAGANWRQCTSDYKVAPILAETRRRLGLRPRSPVPAGTRVEMWLGITVDEIERMRLPAERWIINRYPLIDAGISRQDCINWFAVEFPGRDLPRSSCAGCPFHSDAEWLSLRDGDPDAFADAVRIDKALRADGHPARAGFRNRAFLHVRRKPLAAAVAEAATERAQALSSGPNRLRSGGWGNECAGVCGV